MAEGTYVYGEDASIQYPNVSIRTERITPDVAKEMLERNKFHIGDKVIRKNGRIGTVIGFAIGNDNRHCLVLSMHDGHWRTYLCPIDEARLLKVPTHGKERS